MELLAKDFADGFTQDGDRVDDARFLGRWESDTAGLLPRSAMGNDSRMVEAGGRLPHHRDGSRLHDHTLDVAGDDQDGGREKYEILAGRRGTTASGGGKGRGATCAACGRS